eukprot:1159052-Pelagomonas_calceolata.AAC.3
MIRAEDTKVRVLADQRGDSSGHCKGCKQIGGMEKGEKGAKKKECTKERGNIRELRVLRNHHQEVEGTEEKGSAPKKCKTTRHSQMMTVMGCKGGDRQGQKKIFPGQAWEGSGKKCASRE